MPIESRIVKKTLDSLFGKDINVQNASPLANDDKVIYCTYVNGEGEINGQPLRLV